MSNIVGGNAAGMAADGAQRARLPARGDGADVPGHRLLEIKVGLNDEKQTTVLVGPRDGCQHLLVQIPGDGLI
jgi:hypothetical protein